MRGLNMVTFSFFCFLADVCYNKCFKRYVSFWCWFIYASYICIALLHVQCCWRSGFEPLYKSNLCCLLLLLLWLGARSSGVQLKGLRCSIVLPLPRTPDRCSPSAAAFAVALGEQISRARRSQAVQKWSMFTRSIPHRVNCQIHLVLVLI